MSRRCISLNKAYLQRGFTLIELMIVVAIIAILAAIAYPSYLDHIRKARRGQAKADIVRAAQELERFHTANNTYVGYVMPSSTSPQVGRAFYELELLPAPTQNTFIITARPIADTDQIKDKCGVMTINQAGAKTHSSGGDTECGY